MPVNKEIVEAVRNGECILFLGAMASASSPEGCPYKYSDGPPSGKKLCQDLVDELVANKTPYPDKDSENLQRVSQFYQFAKSRFDLVKAIRERVDAPTLTPSPALRMLAALPFRIIVTTNYDHLFERVLRRARTQDGQDKDPIVHVYDPDLKRVPDHVPLDPKFHKPVLMKLHGDVNKADSIVITEEDYLGFIHKMSDRDHHPLHPSLRARINEWQVLFIGYSMKDYNLRLLFRTLRWHVDLANIPLSYSVDPYPDDLIVSVYQKGAKPMMNFIEENLWTFVPELYEAVMGHPFNDKD